MAENRLGSKNCYTLAPKLTAFSLSSFRVVARNKMFS